MSFEGTQFDHNMWDPGFVDQILHKPLETHAGWSPTSKKYKSISEYVLILVKINYYPFKNGRSIMHIPSLTEAVVQPQSFFSF